MLLNPSENSLTWIKQRYDIFLKRRRQGKKPPGIPRFCLWSGFTVAFISVGFSASGAWELLEQQSYNHLHQAKRALIGAPTWDSRIVVIAIDEASVAGLGRFPWSRDRYADLLAHLQSVQPAVVAFDILFPESTEQDAQFTEAIVGSANVVLAVGSDSPGNYLNVNTSITEGADGFFLRGDISNRADIDGVSRQLPLYGRGAIPSLGLATLQVYTDTLASTAQAVAKPAKRIASEKKVSPTSSPNLFNSRLSSDSLPDPLPDSLLNPVKDKSIWISWPGETIRSSVRDRSSVRESYPEFYEESHEELHKESRPVSATIATGSTGPDESLEKGPYDLQTYSYIDVIEGRVDTSLFQNKIVLVGTTLAGLDPLRTPFQTDPPTSGVYLYAAALNNLLNQSYLRRPSMWQSTLLLIVLAFTSSCLLRRQGVYQRLAVVVGFPLFWCALAFGSFWSGWWIPVAAPIGTLLLSALAIQLYEQQEKQQLMALFSMNVSPGTAELIWRHKGVILHQGELEAQKLTATVLFMDIRGFTSIAETLPSQQLLPWLNQYFETMTDCIMKHGGMVDKYIGDAIMAVFGAPLPRTQPEEIQADAIAALHAALEMHERLRSLNQQLATQNLPLIKFGVGIHTGPLIGGTVGNRHRLNYSLFGDTVNIAARLESMTKALPQEAPFNLLLSAETCRHTQDSFPVQLFRSGQLRGREGHTDVYTINPFASSELSVPQAPPDLVSSDLVSSDFVPPDRAHQIAS